LAGHEWERAPENPCGACPDRDGQILQGPFIHKDSSIEAAEMTARRGVRDGEDDDEGLS